MTKGQAAPTNPAGPSRFALEGRVVTMDASYSILDRGVVYVDGSEIAAVLPVGASPPAGFEDVTPVGTRGTIYPGLIDLHNHLSYDALSLWDVPEKYTNRAQWGRHPDYRRLISGPMTVLGKTPGYVEAVVRYVECKCLLGGVTTSQGIALFSNQGIARFYRGVVRNVEETGEDELPDAATKISDVEAEDVEAFFRRLEDSSCLLLHLSEGTDEAARAHFGALRRSNGSWAITPALTGIHSAALKPEDFSILGESGGAMVWSPLSNLLLYGGTADVGAASEAGVRIGIGSDWSPSGSKNLLGELKVARLVAAERGFGIADRELLAMATREAAGILGWGDALGSVETSKRADLLVLYGRSGDPYAELLEAGETAICLVTIDGVPRVGSERLMYALDSAGTDSERWRVGSAQRVLNLSQETANPVVGALKLGAARDRLRDGLRRLPELARQLEEVAPQAITEAAVGAGTEWTLLLEHEEPPGFAIRPHPELDTEAATPRLAQLVATSGAQPGARAASLSELLEPLGLDPLTVADDASFGDRLRSQRNLPDFLRADLPDLL